MVVACVRAGGRGADRPAGVHRSARPPVRAAPGSVRARPRRSRRPPRAGRCAADRQEHAAAHAARRADGHLPPLGAARVRARLRWRAAAGVRRRTALRRSGRQARSRARPRHDQPDPRDDPRARGLLPRAWNRLHGRGARSSPDGRPYGRAGLRRAARDRQLGGVAARIRGPHRRPDRDRRRGTTSRSPPCGDRGTLGGDPARDP